MTEETPLDAAFEAMQLTPDDDSLRLRFYERLAEAELFMLLENEPGAGEDQITPRLSEIGSDRYIQVFDREARLAAFAGDRAAPFVALSGRVIAGMLSDQDLGIALNPDVSASSTLLPATSVAWLNRMLDNQPDEFEARISEVLPPAGVPEHLVRALDTKLATAMGLADHALLAEARYSDGTRGHLLGFVGAVPEAEGALVRAAGEALSFSGIDAGAMDVAFFRAGDTATERLQRVGLRFDLPRFEAGPDPLSVPPGSDPAKPPKLK